ncbi:MAG: glycosyl hydrolase [Clostridia bacterium]|nr:glycosyl hydrolase [Clostridia bacterium]
MSVVNDVQLEEGKYDNKTPQLLWRLLGDDETMDAHIGALIDLAVSYGVDGIEIDYEAIRKDTALWERYALFLEKLYAEAAAQGLLLRAVLSWDATKYAALPAGPQYTVMCYNLYGYHSGPGPKADQTFLTTTYQLCLSLPGQARMAYATGGFDWTEGANPKALTQTQAEELVAQLGQIPTRDAQSGALTLTYQKDGQTHALWYADGQTLAVWRDWATECGYEGFDLFRMGGNNLDDWLATLWK